MTATVDSKIDKKKIFETLSPKLRSNTSGTKPTKTNDEAELAPAKKSKAAENSVAIVPESSSSALTRNRSSSRISAAGVTQKTAEDSSVSTKKSDPKSTLKQEQGKNPASKNEKKTATTPVSSIKHKKPVSAECKTLPEQKEEGHPEDASDGERGIIVNRASRSGTRKEQKMVLQKSEETAMKNEPVSSRQSRSSSRQVLDKNADESKSGVPDNNNIKDTPDTKSRLSEPLLITRNTRSGPKALTLLIPDGKSGAQQKPPQKALKRTPQASALCDLVQQERKKRKEEHESHVATEKKGQISQLGSVKENSVQMGMEEDENESKPTASSVLETINNDVNLTETKSGLDSSNKTVSIVEKDIKAEADGCEMSLVKKTVELKEDLSNDGMASPTNCSDFNVDKVKTEIIESPQKIVDQNSRDLKDVLKVEEFEECTELIVVEDSSVSNKQEGEIKVEPETACHHILTAENDSELQPKIIEMSSINESDCADADREDNVLLSQKAASNNDTASSENDSSTKVKDSDTLCVENLASGVSSSRSDTDVSVSAKEMSHQNLADADLDHAVKDSSSGIDTPCVISDDLSSNGEEENLDGVNKSGEMKELRDDSTDLQNIFESEIKQEIKDECDYEDVEITSTQVEFTPDEIKEEKDDFEVVAEWSSSEKSSTAFVSEERNEEFCSSEAELESMESPGLENLETSQVQESDKILSKHTFPSKSIVVKEYAASSAATFLRNRPSFVHGKIIRSTNTSQSPLTILDSDAEPQSPSQTTALGTGQHSSTEVHSRSLLKSTSLEAPGNVSDGSTPQSSTDDQSQIKFHLASGKTAVINVKKLSATDKADLSAQAPKQMNTIHINSTPLSIGNINKSVFHKTNSASNLKLTSNKVSSNSKNLASFTFQMTVTQPGGSENGDAPIICSLPIVKTQDKDKPKTEKSIVIDPSKPQMFSKVPAGLVYHSTLTNPKTKEIISMLASKPTTQTTTSNPVTAVSLLTGKTAVVSRSVSTTPPTPSNTVSVLNSASVSSLISITKPSDAAANAKKLLQKYSPDDMDDDDIYPNTDGSIFPKRCKNFYFFLVAWKHVILTCLVLSDTVYNCSYIFL